LSTLRNSTPRAVTSEPRRDLSQPEAVARPRALSPRRGRLSSRIIARHISANRPEHAGYVGQNRRRPLFRKKRRMGTLPPVKMRSADEPDRPRARRHGTRDAKGGILHHDASGRRDLQLRRREQEDVGRGLAACHLIGTEGATPETVRQARTGKRAGHPSDGAAGGDGKGGARTLQPVEKRPDTVDRPQPGAVAFEQPPFHPVGDIGRAIDAQLVGHNLAPADLCPGRAEAILKTRKEIKAKTVEKSRVARIARTWHELKTHRARHSVLDLALVSHII